MPLPGHEAAFGHRLPARGLQEGRAQLVEAIAGTRRQRMPCGQPVSGVGPCTSCLFQTSITGTRAGSRCRRVRAIAVSASRQASASSWPAGTSSVSEGNRRAPSCRNNTASAVSISAQARATPICSMVIGAVAQACGVDHMHGTPSICTRLLDLVAGGAGDRRDDGQLGTCQRIEQRRLAGVRLPGDHDAHAIAQQGALAGLLPDTGQERRLALSGAPVRPPRAGCRCLPPESPGVASTSMRSSVSVCSKRLDLGGKGT
jgi:hypothetical protein